QGYHILHFIGHGTYKEAEGAALYMADEDNRVKVVRDRELVAMLARHLAGQKAENSLRLVFLSSCETATRSPAHAFLGLAPQLVEAGLPAVVAMQDLLPVETSRAFSATFYQRLLAYGQVDLACNQARAAILTAELPGAAIPVLFMRLQNGRLLGWRGEILGDRAEGFWATLMDNIADKWCVPFLGPGVTSGLLPSPVEVAQELAAGYNYPFPATQSLPRVAQFIATLDNRRLREQTMRILVSGFMRRMGQKFEPRDHRRKLSELIKDSAWVQNSHEQSESETHHQLAELGLPLYMTTNLDNFMTLALRAQGLAARRETVADQEATRRPFDRLHFDFDPPPSPEEPVVLHLFGTDEDLHSVVLTEDDYLDYLARISRDYDYMLPTSVIELLASSTLLFLGYRLQDLDLKIILRGLLTNLDLAKWAMLHVAVQIEADVVEEAKRKEVIRYFQKYFASSKIDVYWGTAQQFVADLYARWQERQRE
ncbi:MAG TPA: CHAT domain-containing protein, partial [Xanthomonadales bacterium]|nr:CHAT domain-containing protein [Xanthomonadales bacterium]